CDAHACVKGIRVARRNPDVARVTELREFADMHVLPVRAVIDALEQTHPNCQNDALGIGRARAARLRIEHSFGPGIAHVPPSCMRFQLSPPSSLRYTETGEPPANSNSGSEGEGMIDQICTRSGKSVRSNLEPPSVLRHTPSAVPANTTLVSRGCTQTVNVSRF